MEVGLMHAGGRSRLLGGGLLLVFAGVLALAACSSDSVSGSQRSTSKPAAEAKSAASQKPLPPKGLIDAAIAQTR
jgi:hypothetical protein